MERILSKVSYGTLNARDCLALLRSLNQVPQLEELLAGEEYAHVRSMLGSLDPIPGLTQLLENAIDPEAPLLITDGSVIREGYNAQLDELRNAATLGKQWISDLEAREREETGIKSLKIQFNRVFGYYIEVTKSYYNLVPLRYQRRRSPLPNATQPTNSVRLKAKSPAHRSKAPAWSWSFSVPFAKKCAPPSRVCKAPLKRSKRSMRCFLSHALLLKTIMFVPS